MKPIVLCILDGIGYRKESLGNAYLMAKTPTLDSIYDNYPHSFLKASGEEVGLPKNTMGNSEVGHANLGAGRIVYQPSQYINEQIKTKEIFKNEPILDVFDYVKEKSSNLHIMGLMNDAGVHSTMEHLLTILDMIKENEIKNVFIHCFTDGRDTSPKSALLFLNQLQDKLDELRIGKIASIIGRYYAMDRDNRWDRVEIAYNMLTKGIGEHYSDYQTIINENYKKNITDEFIPASIILEDGIIKENDGIINFNFRPDRLRELMSAFTNPNFDGFERKIIPNLKVITLMPTPSEVLAPSAFRLDKVELPLGEYLDQQGLKQLRLAETEKYAHVTYFFDGGSELKLNYCDQILVPSPKVATYDLSPLMSAKEITDILLEKIEENKYDVIIVNYANGDMLGHTGNIPATVESLEFLDDCIKKVYDLTIKKDGVLLLVADHGNCEYMLDEDGNPVTSHTTNEVPFIITKKDISLNNGKLADVAPTILKLLNLPIPEVMTGESLIE